MRCKTCGKPNADGRAFCNHECKQLVMTNKHMRQVVPLTINRTHKKSGNRWE